MIYRRQLQDQLEALFESEESLLIIGPRQAGKSTLLHSLESKLKEQGKTTFFLDLEDPDYLRLLNQSPKNLFQIFPFDLNERSYLLVDEVQYLINPSNFLKYCADTYKQKIKIIASGSSAFYLDRKFKDSLVGRKRIFRLLSLSFREFLEFKNESELAKKDWQGLTLSEKEKIEFWYYQYLIYGGYPKVVLAPQEEKVTILKDLAYSYIKKDIFEANLRQDEDFYRLLKIMASQIGNLVNINELTQTLGLSKTAIQNYLYIMQKSFHLSLIRPFYKNIRKELTKMPKVYFYDMGLRNFFKNDFRLLMERDDKGALLENGVYRQLIEKYEAEEIRYWRTTNQQEIDLVVEDQKTAYEVKIDSKKIAKNKFRSFLSAYPDFKVNLVSLKGDFYPWLV